MNDEQKAKSLWYSWCPATTCQGFISCVDCPHAHAHSQLLAMAAWKEQQMIEILREIEIEDGDIEDFANEEQSSNYGFSEKFISRIKKAMEAD